MKCHPDGFLTGPKPRKKGRPLRIRDPKRKEETMLNSKNFLVLAGLLVLLLGTVGTAWGVEDICRYCHGTSVADTHHEGATGCTSCHPGGQLIRDCTTSGCHDLDNLPDTCLAIKINDAYTMNDMDEPATEFQVGDTVKYRIDYSISGDPFKKYKVVVIVNSLGDRIKLTEKHYPGDNYITVTSNWVDENDEPGTYTVKYKLKLKKAGVLLDVDKDTSEITVVE
jgi:hypothetical protein